MTRPLVLNDLETKRFGVVCARLDGQGETLPDLSEINRLARDLGVNMISTRVDGTALDRVHALEADGYRLMDCLVYYERRLSDLPEPIGPPEGCSVRWADAADVSEIADVARAAFKGYFGHYHSDPRLPEDAADAAYVEWAETSAEGGDGSLVLVVEDRDGICGFLVFRQTGASVFEIVLNAVAPRARRRGHYRSLLSHAVSFAAEKGGNAIRISTQISNIAVQREWGRQGFEISRSVFTLHKWLPWSGDTDGL